MTSILIYGEPKGEHLRVDVAEESVVLVSHELAVGRVQSQWRNRVLVSMSRATWQVIAEKIK